MNKDFEQARLKLIIPRDNTLFRETLEKGALKPLLAHTPTAAEQSMEDMVARLLAPRSQDDDHHTLFDLALVLDLYIDQFDQMLPHEIQDPTEQPEAIKTSLPGIPESVIRHCSSWVSNRLKAQGQVSFADVFNAYEEGELSEQEQQVCLLHIGSLATNNDHSIEVDVNGTPIESALWRADNIILLTAPPAQPFEE